MVTIKGYGCYVIKNMLTELLNDTICRMKGFVGYDDMSPIRFYFFLSKSVRDDALSCLAINCCLCGALEDTIDITPNYEGEDYE